MVLSYANNDCFFMKTLSTATLFCIASVIIAQASPPGPRHLEEVAFDTKRNVLLVAGGGEFRLGEGTVFPDHLSEWNGSTWTDFETSEPKNRYGHALIYSEDEDATFQIGGVNEAARRVALDVWKWKDKKWERVSTDCPAKTLEATYPMGKRVLVYGDVYNKTELRQGSDPLAYELWEFKANKWKKLSSEGPQIGSQFEIAFDKRRNALVIPTWDDGKSVVWEWRNEKWSRVQASNDSPDERNRFSLAYHPEEKVTYLFGGRNEALPFMNDVWKWDGEKWTAVKSNAPPGRAAALMEYGNGGLYVYGGVVSWGLSNEIWKWQNGTWKLINEEYAMTESRTAQTLKEWTAGHPEDAAALTSYGTLLGKQKKYDEAITHLTKAHRINPVEHNILMNLCDVLYEYGKGAEARAFVSEAVQQGTMQHRSYLRMANYFLSGRKLELSVLCFEKAISLQPEAGDYYNLACAFALLKDSDKAFVALEKSRELGFDSKDQLKNDTDLESLHSDSRWKKLLEKLH
jgi:tetratricopeptide (TPR) repeat protein